MRLDLFIFNFQVGNQLSPKTFNRLFERVSRLQQVHIPGQQRTIYLRFCRNYPLENNEWGDFQVCNYCVQQESPPAWTQEAYRPRHINYSICCPVPGGGEVPHPRWGGGQGGPNLTGVPPCGQTDRHVSKHNLPVVLRTRSVITYNSRAKLLKENTTYLIGVNNVF